jgi:dolichol-phosphate mannosyltransferase
MRTVVVIPTFNEAANIEPITKAVLDLGIDGLSVLIVDDDSPDGTGKVADRLDSTLGNDVDVLHRQGERGLGRAYVDGFTQAMSLGADTLIQMDADFSHSPQYLPIFLKLIKHYDVVVGSRYVARGSVDDRWETSRYLLSRWANFYARSLLGITAQDTTSGFKCWRRSALELIDLKQILSDGYVFQVEMAYVAERLGLSTSESPIHFEDRRVGQSKMTLPVKLEASWRVLQVRWRHRRLKPAPETSPSSARDAGPVKPVGTG